jgi:hypothetical protein
MPFEVIRNEVGAMHGTNGTRRRRAVAGDSLRHRFRSRARSRHRNTEEIRITSNRERRTAS